jgi:hypothetical protein
MAHHALAIRRCAALVLWACALPVIVELISGTAYGQRPQPGVPPVKVPQVQVPPPNINYEQMNRGIEEWQRSQEEARRNSAIYTRDVPPGPDPKKSAEAANDIFDFAFMAALVVGAIVAISIAAHFYLRARGPATSQELALSDPWIRAKLAERQAATQPAAPQSGEAKKA